MVRSDREGVGMERWEKWDEAELKYLAENEGSTGSTWPVDPLGYNDRFAVGEVVRIKGQKGKELGVIGVVIRPFEYTGLYVAFPQHDTPQLVPAKWMEKVNED